MKKKKNKKESFDDGVKAFKLGKSIHYNPYRNTGAEDSELYTSWSDGHNSCKK